MKTYNATGSLAGFESSIFDEGLKLENKWVVNDITVTFEDRFIKINFHHYDSYYQISGNLINNAYADANIICDEELCGKLNVSLYPNKAGFILQGIWKEGEVSYEVWGKFNWKNKKQYFKLT